MDEAMRRSRCRYELRPDFKCEMLDSEVVFSQVRRACASLVGGVAGFMACFFSFLKSLSPQGIKKILVKEYSLHSS